jgi:SAM-dependent methyltransferase
VSLYDKILGHPFVYDVLRPFVVGGVDMTAFFSRMEARASDVVLDVGCGTGAALDYLPTVARYVGFDTDERALAAGQKRAKDRLEPVEFHARELQRADVESLQPHVVSLAGLLHHLDDDTCIKVLQMLRASQALRRVVTWDVTFLPGELVNNLLSILDRGQYPRHPGGYNFLAEKAGYRIDEAHAVSCGGNSGRAKFWLMSLSPRSSPKAAG